MATVPLIELDGLSDAERGACILAYDKLAVNAGCDTERLAPEIGDLGALRFDLSLAGFRDEEIAGLLNNCNAGLTDPDDFPEAPVSRMDDVWLLEQHVWSAATVRTPTMSRRY